MKRINAILWTLLLLFTALWLVRKWESIPSLKAIFQPKEVTIDNTAVLVQGIKSIAQLVTVSAYDEIVTDSAVSLNVRVPSTMLLPSIPLPFFSVDKKLVLIGRTTTHVGLNMQKLNTDAVRMVKDSIHISLPPAEVLDVILNPSDVDIFIEQGSWDNTAITRLKNKIRFIAVANVRSKGLFMQSEQKARALFINFFRSAGFKKITVDFKG